MDKNDLDQKIAKWLKNFLTKKLSPSHELLEVIIPESNLSKLADGNIKSRSDYSAWEFKPDVVAVLKNKSNGKIELVLVNRSLSALSLKEIGELYCYSKLVNAKLSFLVSLNGVSNEVSVLLLENEIRQRLLHYGDGNEIIIFSWNEKDDEVDANSVIPLDKKGFLLD